MYLLDTHIVIWLVYQPEKIKPHIEQILLDSCVPVYFSTVNLWEVAIKVKLGKFDIQGIYSDELYQTLQQDLYLQMPILAKHCTLVEHLPLLHSDPFDRLLIAQAISENLTLITHDSKIINYQYSQDKLLKGVFKTVQA